MAAVRTFTLPHYDAYPVQVALFSDVRNAAFLRSQLLAANPEFDYAFLDAAMILTPQHLLTATFLALHAFLNSTHKTRTPHSELVFRLSPNNNIGESYRTFGLTDTTTRLIAVKLPINADGTRDDSVSNEKVGRHLGSAVEGVSVELSEDGGDLGRFAEVHRIKKVYKITCAKSTSGKGAKGGPAANAEKKDDRSDIEAVILGTMALKGS
ncbi:CGI-121-domain-containing protein [Didymella exigua CBS 183.55]|uniref:EKC/KEOPS complex subunit CGI121 n=1 Tax=Didymella exigua CBS 183.55 TaxID=1150837 RepID=A0A6A5RPX7_9PLEO|nr:CGI-121-domain-containing protein [Didymella exigua CBS 183.55]KAF1930491.1 CGI-121-domain-containing protein [Didymella exigua CBS 183.55]